MNAVHCVVWENKIYGNRKSIRQNKKELHEILDGFNEGDEIVLLKKEDYDILKETYDDSVGN